MEVALVIAVIAALFVIRTIKIVPQQHAWVVERLGLLRGSHPDDDCPRKAVPQGFPRVLR